MRPSVIIIGAGGHARVVADALLARGERVVGFTDADPSRHGTTMCDLPILGDDAVLESTDSIGSVLARAVLSDAVLANGIGGVKGETLRASVQARLEKKGWRFIDVLHPSAVVSSFAVLGAGTQVMAGAVVQAGASVGDGSIINTGAVVEHDSQVGAFVHVATRATLCGDVIVGAGSHIGAGCVIRQGVRLGERTIVGAGAVVVKDFLEGGVLVGVPAKIMEPR